MRLIIAITVVIILTMLGLARDSQALTIGIGEQQASAYNSGHFQKLNIKNVRIIVPWDAWKEGFARHDADAALGEMKRLGIEPLVVIGRSRYTRRLPRPAVYQKYVTALVRRHRWVKYWSPINEANFIPDTKNKPRLAAAYQKGLFAACLTYQCRTVSPSVLDSKNLLSWSLEYRAALPLRMRPSIWLLHNYHDANFFTTQYSRPFLKAMNRHQIWLAEVGGLVRGNGPNSSKWPKGLNHQVKVFNWLMNDVIPNNRRINRVYFYQWQAPYNARWDSGIMNPNYKPRPVYFTLLDYLVSQGKAVR